MNVETEQERIASHSKVAEHYTVHDLIALIRRGLVSAGKNPNALSPEDLAPVDEFHIRGRESTVELAEMAELWPTARVIDIGCGLGGTARYLATRYGCRVTGVDLTPTFVSAAQELSAMVGLTDSTRFICGSALDLPVASGSFDIAWTEHVQMNIADKVRFYSEARRVLAPGGRLVFHDIFAGRGGPAHYPTPWASDPSLSALAMPQEIHHILASLGMHIERWVDVTERSQQWFSAMLQRTREQGPPPLGIHLLLGQSAPEKLMNVERSLNEQRLTIAQAVVRK